MNYRTYLTVVLWAALVLVSVAVPTSLAEQSQLSNAGHANFASSLHLRAETESAPAQPASPEYRLARPAEPQGSLFRRVAFIADVNHLYICNDGRSDAVMANCGLSGAQTVFSVTFFPKSAEDPTLDPDHFALRANNGKIVSLSDTGLLVANGNQSSPSLSQGFILVRTHGLMAFKASNGKYVSASGGGELVANSTQIGSAEMFNMYPF